ncbi:MAG: hypothetical protein QM764_21740 [Chitinophagaceae bacterium]
MQKSVLSVLLTFFLVTVYAQEQDSVIALPGITVTASSKVKKQVTAAFNKAFPDAVAARWIHHNKNYLVRFIKEDRYHQALFHKNGYLKYDISYGYESNLPADVAGLIKSSYRGYMITRTALVSQDNRSIWIVNLKSLKYFILLKIEEDEVDEVERLKRID